MDGPVSPAVTTGGALRPECWPLPPSALGQPWTRAPGGGRDRWLRARRDVLSDTTLPRHAAASGSPAAPVGPAAPRGWDAWLHLDGGLRAGTGRVPPATCRSRSRARQLRPLGLSPLDSSLGPARANTRLRETSGKAPRFCPRPRLGVGTEPGAGAVSHSTLATCRAPRGHRPHHSHPRRVRVHPCFWSRLPSSC